MTTPQNIAFVCHPYHRGGVTRWMADAAIALAGMGINTWFVTVEPTTAFHSSGGRETMTSLLKRHAQIMNLVAKKADYSFEFGTEEYRTSVYRKLIADHVPKGTPVIISDDEAAWAAVATLADKYPMIGVLHGDQDYYYDKAKKYHEQLAVCVCVSERIKRTAAGKCPGIDPDKLFTIPCGVNMPVFKPEASTANAIKMIFVGRLTDYEKRAHDLVKICALMHRSGIPFHLDIVGNSDSSATEFTTYFRENGVDAFVSFHGWLAKSEVQRKLDGADVMLLTSNSEGMPLVLMEALASGCGFTGTRVSGIEDYEHDPRGSDCVSVYTVGDIEDAVQKIRKITAIPKSKRQIAARKLAEAEFSMEACLEKYFIAIATTWKGTIVPRTINFTLFDALYSKILALCRRMKTGRTNRTRL